MTLKEVRYLVSGGESHTVEFKRKATHPEKIIREMVAFANSDGGHVFIGVDDDGSIPGLKHPEDEVYVLEAALDLYTRPKVKYNWEIVPISEDLSVVSFFIPSSDRSPHFVLEKRDEQAVRSNGRKKHVPNRVKKAFVRAEDKSVQASREMKEIIRRKRKGRNVKFHYGDKEKLLFNYLDEHGTITLEEFANLAGISKYSASRTLILLVLANVIKIIPTEKGDLYVGAKV
jgi:predicted HTH transcriptional regulator